MIFNKPPDMVTLSDFSKLLPKSIQDKLTVLETEKLYLVFQAQERNWVICFGLMEGYIRELDKFKPKEGV